MSTTQLYYMLQWPKIAPPLILDVLEDHMLQLTHWLKEIKWVLQNNCPAGEFSRSPENVSDSILQSALLQPHQKSD